MPITSIPVFIVKAPGRLSEGLCSLLENHPSVKIMGVFRDEISLFQQLSKLPMTCIVLLDVDVFGNHIFTICQHLKIAAPQSVSIVLVDTDEQKRQALFIGASDGLIKGYTANELLNVIQRKYYAKSIKSREATQPDMARNNNED